MQGFNRYYPPDYDPSIGSYKGNLNRLAGKTAQKPVVRFEMPFNVWCLSCNAHIAQGVRFNATKSKTGQYFTSPIYAFKMSCHLCAGAITIATNPKDTCYDVLEGAKKKAEEWNAADNGTFEFSHDAHKDTEVDPLYKLEKDATSRTDAEASKSHNTLLLQANARQWSDPYSQSQRLRRKFRGEKAVLREKEQSKQILQNRHGLGINLLDPEASDKVAAKTLEFSGRAGTCDEAKRRAILHAPILGSSRTHKHLRAASFTDTRSTTSSNSTNKLNLGVRKNITKVQPSSERN